MTTTIHHPSCPQRPDHEQGANWEDRYLSSRPACLCGPEAQAEDRLILMHRSPDAMVLDIVSHAANALSDFTGRCRRGPVSGLLPRVYRRNLGRVL